MKISIWIGIALLLLVVAYFSSLAITTPKSSFVAASTQSSFPATANAIAPLAGPAKDSVVAMLVPTVSIQKPGEPIVAGALPPPQKVAAERGPDDERPKLFGLLGDKRRNLDKFNVLLRGDPAKFDIRHFNNRKEDATIEALAGQAKVKVTGRLKFLNVESLNGEAILDIRELEVQEITVGPVNGASTLIIATYKTEIYLRGPVKGGAKVYIESPHGNVTIGSVGEISVDGGTELNIYTKTLALKGTAAGGARINATMAKGGSISFEKLDGGANLIYRKVYSKDPDLLLEPGEIRAGGIFRELKN